MKANVQKAINEQINAEIYSAYLYLSMATYFDGNDLPGFANWMKVQSEEEMSHAMKFYDFIYERGGEVEMKAIAQPPVKFKSALAIAQDVLAHEKEVTSLIHALYELAQKEKDYPLQSLLHWYIDEQVEEESSAGQLVDRLKMVGDKGPGLFMLDKELAGRTFTPPTAT